MSCGRAVLQSFRNQLTLHTAGRCTLRQAQGKDAKVRAKNAKKKKNLHRGNQEKHRGHRDKLYKRWREGKPEMARTCRLFGGAKACVASGQTA